MFTQNYNYNSSTIIGYLLPNTECIILYSHTDVKIILSYINFSHVRIYITNYGNYSL